MLLLRFCYWNTIYINVNVVTVSAIAKNSYTKSSLSLKGYALPYTSLCSTLLESLRPSYQWKRVVRCSMCWHLTLRSDILDAELCCRVLKSFATASSGELATTQFSQVEKNPLESSYISKT